MKKALPCVVADGDGRAGVDMGDAYNYCRENYCGSGEMEDFLHSLLSLQGDKSRQRNRRFI